MEKRYWIAGSAIVVLALGYSAFKTLEARQYRIQAENLMYQNNILLGEINLIENKPGYNDGYRDAIIKIGVTITWKLPRWMGCGNQSYC